MNKNFLFKNNSFLVALLFIITFSACTLNSDKAKNEPDNYNQLKQLFNDPPAEYRSAPLWDWNDKITEEGIDFQMQKFKEGGLGGVFIHPRPGLITEYLSDEWNHLYDHTIKKAKELGMKVWIYDENSYPSGFAGGHVPAEMPESYNSGTGIACEIQETFKPDSVAYEIIIKKTDNGFKDITGDIRKELGSKGTYYLFRKTYSPKSYWYGNFPYVDLLYKGVTQKFMELTMKGYEKYNRADFGKTLMGIFTDEPNLEAAMDRKSAFRWTPDLSHEFSKRWGYNLEINYPSLVDEVGNWRKVRHDYYVTLLEMFLERWSKPWNKYCEENNLMWTGHYWEHGWPRPTEGIDEAAFYIYHQQPGIDMLGNEMIPNGRGGQFGNTRAVRELLSAANQAGYSRRLSETYGGAGWEINFKNLKRLLDWEVVLGVNFVNQHLSYYTMKGVRKFDYPPTFSYQEPWWSDYKIMGDYIGRICLATSAGQQINKTLVLQPNTTAWMYFSRKRRNPFVDSIQQEFTTFIYNLERNHYEYDLGSEYVLRTMGSVDGPNLIIGKRTYNLIVIPGRMENLDNQSYKLLASYLSRGGKVLSFTQNILYLDGAESDKIKDLMTKYSGQWFFAKTPDDNISRKILSSDDFSISERSTGGELYHQRRILHDGQAIFFANSDTMNIAVASIKLKGSTVVKMDPVTGKCYKALFKKEGNMVSFELNLPPVGSALYFISDKPLEEPDYEADYNKEEIINPVSAISVQPGGENVLVLDYMDFKSGNINLSEQYFMKCMYKLFDINKFPMGNPWQHKIQYKQDYLGLDTFKIGSGFEASYHFTVEKEADPGSFKDLYAVIERPEVWLVYLNGKIIQPSDKWWTDRDFTCYPISDFLKNGENIITIKADKMSVHAELMPVYIIGDFVLKSLKTGFGIQKGKLDGLGSWKENGFPFYSQKVTYSQKFNISESSGGKAPFIVRLNKWNGTLAEIEVNGTKAGIIGWPPYQINVASLLKEGENEIAVTIAGSLKNSFGYFYKDPKRAINGPGDWNTAPDKIPSIDQYFLVNYGLFEPFSLIRLR